MSKPPDASVAAIITLQDACGTKVLLTMRNHEPFKGYWCLPGGHVEANEPIEDAIRREVKEETGLDFTCTYFRSFDEILPDINHHTVVNVFMGSGQGKLVAQEEEVLDMKWFPLNEACLLPLAFTHNQALLAYAAVNPDKEGLLVQYDALRAEVLHRMDKRQELLTLTIAGAAAFTAVVTGEIVVPIVLLLYPFLALCAAIAWSHHDVRIGEIGAYIREHIEPYFSGLRWERHIRSLYEANAPSKRVAEYASLGIFVGTEAAAVLLALCYQFLDLAATTPPDDTVYLIFFAILAFLDVVVGGYTYRFIRERRNRYFPKRGRQSASKS
ncbi:MAG: NUDIX hydrolase [Anaerolineae bacterium]|nr:NUDIX hydrolase [Anaerolineae bacterium]